MLDALAVLLGMLKGGKLRGVGELWDILLSPLQPMDDPVTSAAREWSEELVLSTLAVKRG